MLTSRSVAGLFILLTGAWIVAVSGSVRAVSPPPQAQASAARLSSSTATRQSVLQRYCVTCHNQRLKTAGLALEHLTSSMPQRESRGVGTRDREAARAARCRPAGRPRPDAATYDALRRWLEGEHRSRVGRESESRPDQRGPSPQSHRVQQRGPRPVRARHVDVKSLLPGDETADGSFDNFADVLTISTAHLERYLSVARQVTRLATGLPPASPALDDLRDSAARRPGRSAERRPAVRIARRHRGPLQVSGRRRVPDQGPAAPAVSGLPDGHGLAAAARRAPRRQAAEAIHRRRRRARTSGRGELRRRRRAGLCRRSRVGNLHAGRRRRGPRGPRAGLRRDRASSACRSCASCGSRRACRSRCSAAAC